MEPGSTRVMEPILAKWEHSHGDCVYQVKWDGVRMLAFVDRGRVILQNRQGRIKTATFPELDCLCSIKFQPVILDGEVVVIKDGRPSFSMILHRNFLPSPGLGSPPVSFVVFDILQFLGNDVRTMPLVKRQELLAQTMVQDKIVSVIDNFDCGEDLFALTGKHGWEGIVGKEINSPYVSGKSQAWKKYKHIQSEVFSIVGFVVKHDQLGSILVAKDFGQGLVLTGAVGSGLSNRARTELYRILQTIETKRPPLAPPRKHTNWHWVNPLLMAKVEFMEWTESLTLRAPVFKNLLWEGDIIELS